MSWFEIESNKQIWYGNKYSSLPQWGSRKSCEESRC